MKGSEAMRRLLVSAVLLLIGTSLALAQPFTRRSSQMQHDELKKTYEIANFRLGGKYDLSDPSKWESGGEGGVTLESLGAGKLRTAYIAIGNARRNAAGEITNAVIVNSYYSGDSTDMYEQWVKGAALSGGVPIIGPGRPIDTDRYYVVMVDPLGTWGASKPSDGLGIKFPQYSYYDMVQANYRMLRDGLKIARAALITGVSMGGTQTYVWGVMHPEFIGALMPIGGTTQSDGDDPVGNWTFQMMTAAIQSDPVWQQTKGDYYKLPKEKHPVPGLAFGWSILGMTGYDFAFRTSQNWSAVQPEIFYWDPPNEKAGLSVINRAKLYDAVDLVWRNRVGETHNVNPYLGRVRARTLVMHITNDLWLNFKLAEKAVDRVPGADLIAQESPVAHYGVFPIINQRKNDPKFVSFMDDVAALDRAQTFDDKSYRVPGVAENIDPKKSFWKDFVTYPYPVKYANAKDKSGNSWQIGYMDEYAGTDKDPKVLVIIHGKGAFAGHYGNVMQYALRSGVRVIAPDLPHYGMSGPGNLDKSPARTMQDMREVIYDLVVNQLGVKKAYYLGHSLGGQFVMGYALTWPDAVQGLALEAPSGLEEYPRDITIAKDKKARLFDQAFDHDFDKWKATWGPTGILDAEMKRSEQNVRDFFYFKKRDPETNVVSASKSGYFFSDSEYARLHTEQRVGLIKGNPKELEQWCNVFIYDIYTIGAELQQDNPKNLYERLTQIKAPIFLSFGDKEPFIPTPAFNGLTDLGRDAITPFMSRMTNAGNRPLLKVYPETGHFIHTDNPVEFPADVVDFVTRGTVDTSSPLGTDRMIKGAVISALPVAPTPPGAAPTAGLNK
ncbi:alpha/beta hydrolase [Bradyrhizobium sp. WBOS7]|uniref:Alpha/beta hydrolase n=1 Tax=Bradyrhizobium betae TaxID=244734 RepID=A0AAE9NAW6_9BRAD|nr:alpha/beta hydrolase [Bradyrhizobium sp. WBOS2]MDD1569823.1 alpha/beta hydrolase [Bradyrhizobium sp. WBOS1]MDD1575922.1 alpha/beta hydrolase [Bradyrhizobium sp. WBOS7]MDD1599489.1 alpha/beta hydrolase [Bradyrhizobium sp. WBOS16]UUO35709.1 alpha/beta hydrolase [Bradyrhizobium sp. WBOS01]UUO42017.1 alpha/beta hydrolase [Bradyrhizobium sp. WBOS02]UUO56353.1 alpha/beta hydrolase [Bradyrhizobium sp. WBOS07]UUO66347.1 alpha/beta hydrolase [Bradyrhizobium betae]